MSDEFFADPEEERFAQPTPSEADQIMERLRFILGQGMAFVTDAQDPRIAAWQLSFALGTDNCVGHTMTSKSQELGVSTACLSKGATKLSRMLSLPPSPYMLSVKAQDAYRDLRKDQESIREGSK